MTDRPHESIAREGIERVARASYGRLVAALARRTRDLESAEDALADAFAAALSDWPASGLPHDPEAWLITTAHRRLIDRARRERVASKHAAIVAVQELAGIVEHAGSAHLPDERLALLFACAHPALEPGVRIALVLQAVLGLDAATIASAMVLSPTAVAQRLVRAKSKLKLAGVSFDVPPREQWGERLPCVLEAVYGAFGVGHGRAAARGLAEEASDLARLLADLMPDEPEAQGLCALLLYCRARMSADADDFVPMQDQHPERWAASLIAEAEQRLALASRAQTLGRYQLEAAIQSAHVDGARRGTLDWPAIVDLYRGLMALAPSIGAAVGLAAAQAELSGPHAGLAALDRIDRALIADYQPAWALRAHLLSTLGRSAEARAAYTRAAGLCEDPAVRAFLLARRDRL